MWADSGLLEEAGIVSWAYDGHDAGISLFSACLKAGAPLDFKPGMRILEVGCCEEDWLERAAAAWPDCEFVGIDWNAKDASQGNWARWNGDVRQADLFEPNSFDAVVSLSAIEHIGLGHYGDPKDEDGDSKAVANIWKWLKPGGQFYFDVPYNPCGYKVLGTECRIYDDGGVVTRLYRPFNNGGPSMVYTAFSDSKAPGTLVDRPKVPASRYYYVAMLWRKA